MQPIGTAAKVATKNASSAAPAVAISTRERGVIKTHLPRRASREKLPPITITIADQDEIRRIHRAARWMGSKPGHEARRILRMGTWESLRVQEEIDAREATA